MAAKKKDPAPAAEPASPPRHTPEQDEKKREGITGPPKEMPGIPHDEAAIFDARRNLLSEAHDVREKLASTLGASREALDVALGGALPAVPPKR